MTAASTSAPFGRRARFVVVLGAALLLDGFLLERLSDQRAVGEMACLAGAVLCAGLLCLRVLRGVRGPEHRLDELVALASIACFALGDYLTAGIVALLMLGALALEEHTASGALIAVESLLALAPKKARRLRDDDAWDEIPAHELAVGELVKILPGDAVPADGTIETGASALNEASVTGESMPVDKTPGDVVYAGTLNLTGSLDVRVDKVGEDTTLARVRNLIVEARRTRPRIAGALERAVMWYPPVVIMLAGLVLILTEDWGRAISTIVAACPVALVVAVPSAAVAALAHAYRNGILVKRPQSLETAAGVSALVIDKTGTLTCGELRIVKVCALEPWREDELLARGAAVARLSQHPVARALCAHARALGIEIPQAAGVREEPGRGLVGTVAGEEVRIGRPEFLAHAGMDAAALGRFEADLRGFSTLAVAARGSVAGAFALEDRARPEARAAMDALRAAGVGRIVLITGDRTEVAQRTAADVGIAEVIAECLPDEKLAFVRRLRDEGHRVLVAGDGVNDAPALAAGDLSVAVGSGTSEIAIESADVALLRSDLRGITALLALARKSRGVAGQNLAIGGGLIVCGMFLAAFGYLSPVAAAVVQNAGALAVLLSSARLVSERGDGERA